MLDGMSAGATGRTLLLMDTCGERATIAVIIGPATVYEAELPARSASAQLMPQIRALLQSAGVSLAQVTAIGVVSGPGSFTGVRVGMAVAKGLSLSAGLPLVAVSRLAVLADAADLRDGFAVLGAGREDVYVREEAGKRDAAECMMRATDLVQVAGERDLVCAAGEPIPSELLCRVVGISAASARALVEQGLEQGPTSVNAGAAVEVDANYVRNEQGIYRTRVGLVVDGG